MTEAAERALLDELDRRRPRVEQAVSAADYRQAFVDVAALRPVVDRFFAEVFVMADDERLRMARLTLMADLRDLIVGSRRHFGNRSSNGVDSRHGKEARAEGLEEAECEGEDDQGAEEAGEAGALAQDMCTSSATARRTATGR